MKSKLKETLTEVCENKGYKVMDNPLSDNTNSVQIVRENEKWNDEDYLNDKDCGVLFPIQLEINQTRNESGEISYVYRDYRYPTEHPLCFELSDYQTLDEIKDVILNGGMGINYGWRKFEEVISLEEYENSQWYIEKYNLNKEVV